MNSIKHVSSARVRAAIATLAISVTVPAVASAAGAHAAAAAPTYQAATLTPYHSDTIKMTAAAGNVYLAAPSTSSTSSYFREVLWSGGSAMSLNQQSCATWVGESDPNLQEGVALRIVQTPAGIRAITVTKNVIYGVRWIFNVHTWDTTNAAQPYTQVAQFDMSKIILNDVSRMRFLPWTVCLRAVGATVTFKIWFPLVMSEPTWTDPNYTRVTTVPAPYGVPGLAGWYVGHVPANAYTQYTNLTTRVL